MNEKRMKYDIITFGGAVVDAFLDTGVAEKKEGLCYPIDEKILVKELWFATGGGGTNTAVAFSRLGLKTGFLGKVGKDSNGKMILDELKKEKVEFLGRQSAEGPTGFSVVLDSKEDNRVILMHKGINENISFGEIDLRRLKTGWFYFASMVGETFDAQIRLAKWASRRGVQIAYNPSSYLTKTGGGKLRKLLKEVDILILNDGEARDLTREKNIFNGLHKLGPSVVCVTYGKEGSAVSDGKNVYSVRARKVKVEERTGAGDAFASGFVAEMIRTGDIQMAARAGSLNAESVIQKKGAKNGLLRRKELDEKLKNNNLKIILGG